MDQKELVGRLVDLVNTSTDLKADLWKLIYELRAAHGVARLDPVPTAESFDGITGRPYGVKDTPE